MKHCPTCNFSFPDSHTICDFDGTELISVPKQPPVVRTPSRPVRFLRGMKSPVLWAAVLLMFVLSTAFLTAYLDVTRQSPSTVQNALPATPVANPIPPEQSPAEVSTPETAADSTMSSVGQPSRVNHHVRRATLRRSPTQVARSRFSRAPSASGSREVLAANAQVRDSRQESEEKQPKLTAVLKTTWRVIKWPFRF